MHDVVVLLCGRSEDHACKMGEYAEVKRRKYETFWKKTEFFVILNSRESFVKICKRTKASLRNFLKQIGENQLSTLHRNAHVKYISLKS